MIRLPVFSCKLSMEIAGCDRWVFKRYNSTKSSKTILPRPVLVLTLTALEKIVFDRNETLQFAIDVSSRKK